MTTSHQPLPLTKTIAPADQAAVADAIREAYAAGTPVYPIGGATSLDYGVRSQSPGIGLSLANLNRVVDHAADDMTITVEAGHTMAALAKQLAAAGQRLPLDVSQAEHATVGGVVATNHSGPRRYASGTLRDYVIGIRAVDGRGMPFSGGGRVVKNAAGYDLCKLMVGSLGTLGVITQVTLMVRPMPETSALVACDLPDFETAERLLEGLVQSQTLPAAVELLSGPTSSTNPAIGPMLQSSVARLFVGFEGSRAEVDWMVEQLHNEWNETGINSPIVVGASETDLLWHWLTDLPADVRIHVLPSVTVGVIEKLLEVAPDCSIQAHAGDGVIRVDLSSLEPDRLVATLNKQIRPAVAAAGGHMVVLSQHDGAEWTHHEIWGQSVSGVTVMRAIKDRFDPDHLLNRGRIVFADA